MDYLVLAILVILLAFFILMVIWMVYLQKKIENISISSEPAPETDQRLVGVIHNDMRDLQTNVKELRDKMERSTSSLKDTVEERMSDSQKSLHKTIDKSTKVLVDLKGDLAKVYEAQSQIKGLDETVKGLEKIFTSPKLRGLAGEFTLESILEDALPGQYKSQHYFLDHTAVDVAVFIKDKIVPIDAKFPLDRYKEFVDAPDENREGAKKELFNAIQLNMKSISEKYIKPGEGTMDFALMYIPSNKMFYDIFLQDEGVKDSLTDKLLSLANKTKVFPVCPATLYIYLKAIGLGLKGLKIEESAQEIIKRLEFVRKKFDKFKDEYEKVEKGIQKVQRDYDDSVDRFRKFDQEMERILRLKIEEGVESDGIEWGE